MKEAVFYVYVIYRPSGVPCYVGKGKGRRYRLHFWRPQNPHLANIIAQAGGALPVKIVRDKMTELKAFDLEKKLIRKIGREAHGGPLINLTDGGDGVTGVRHSLESRRLRSERQKGKPVHPNSLAALRRPETRAKASAKTRGQKRSDEARAKISIGIRNSSLFQDAMKKRIGIPLSIAVRQRMSESAKGKVIGPRQREIARKNGLGKKQSTETIQKRRDTMRRKREGVVGTCGLTEGSGATSMELGDNG